MKLIEETRIRDSVALGNCKTWRDLEYVVRNVESRHQVEGISDDDLAAWEAEKAEHAKRVLRAVTA